MLTTVDTMQRPSNALAALVIGFLDGSKPPPGGLDLITLEAQRHVVPTCAMRVGRAQEMGALSHYAPATPCGCYYEKAANGTTSCTPCDTDNDCKASGVVCSYHYCETP
jgi:hypothetical protein